MSWTLLLGVVLVLGLSLFAAASRRTELARMGRALKERERTRARLSADGAEALLQHPVVDLSRCLGCATCVAVCPEDGVIEIVHGQAVVVNGSRCQGVSACERECPVGAITVTIANLEQRRDVPVVSAELEAHGSPNLFLAGEVTAHALIKRAIEHGVAVADEVARRVRASEEEMAHAGTAAHAPPSLARGSRARAGAHAAARPGRGAQVSVANRPRVDAALPARARDDVLDLCIVGAGPAGLACSLEAKRLGLSFVTLDQEEQPGGTVAKYPRRKLVLTQPVEMPLVGTLAKTTYTKEELVDLWQRVAVEQELPIAGGESFRRLERDENGDFLVHTETRSWKARHVCLAIGRRGSPRKLGVPGEELPKVAYSLLDASSYQHRRILVVGGGDSAVECALGLSEQPGNEVVLSYRKDDFFRIRSRNAERLERALAERKLHVFYRSAVRAIRADSVELEVGLDGGGIQQTIELQNDEVFVMVGGVPPFELLESSGVSFDPALRAPAEPVVEQGTGLWKALRVGFALSLAALAWALGHADYYLLEAFDRPAHDKHALLRPGMGIGLALGVASTVLIVLNLLYLVRRSARFALKLGSLQAWMTSHVATGILAFLCATLHGAMDPRDTVGGHAWLALAFLLVTGAIGRYFYSWVPRAANGRELELEEVKARLAVVSNEWEQGERRFRERAREEISALVDEGRWKGSFAGRVLAMLGLERGLARALSRIEARGREEGIDRRQVRETLALARRAHATALAASHLEDLRSVLASWRYLHRWVAVLMVVLVVVHVVYALVYGESTDTGGLR